MVESSESRLPIGREDFQKIFKGGTLTILNRNRFLPLGNGKNKFLEFASGKNQFLPLENGKNWVLPLQKKLGSQPNLKTH